LCSFLLLTLLFWHLLLPLSFIPFYFVHACLCCASLLLLGGLVSVHPRVARFSPSLQARMDFGAPIHHVPVIDFRTFSLRLYGVAHIPSSFLVSSVTNHALAILLLGHSTSLSRHTSLSTAPPHSSAALTIFYILYHPYLPSLRILLFSTLWLWTVQNVDASSLSSVPMLSLLCSLLLPSLVRFSAPGVLLVWFLSLFFSSPFYCFACHSLCFITHSTLIQTMLSTSPSWPSASNQNTP